MATSARVPRTTTKAGALKGDLLHVRVRRGQVLSGPSITSRIVRGSGVGDRLRRRDGRPIPRVPIFVDDEGPPCRVIKVEPSATRPVGRKLVAVVVGGGGLPLRPAAWRRAPKREHIAGAQGLKGLGFPRVALRPPLSP